MPELRPTRDAIYENGQPRPDVAGPNLDQPRRGIESLPGVHDQIVPHLLGENLLLDLHRRDGEHFYVTLDVRQGSVDLILRILAILWNRDPLLAQAILDHVNDLLLRGSA